MQLQTVSESQIILHEYVRTWAYKIIDKPYGFYNHRIVPDGPLTFGQRLFCLLFPFALRLMIVFGFIAFWGITLNYYPSIFVAPWWNHILLAIWVLLLFYNSVPSGADLLFSTWLIIGKLSKQPERDTKNY